MSEENLYNRAEKRVDEKIGFYRHLYSFIVVNVILLVINILFSRGEWWFYWVTFFWGIGLVSHFIKTFIIFDKFDEKHRESMIEKEMEKMRK
ncbi:MAG: 2TM domain-containing protein [Methanobrevibacter sp.]|nr:2TM domain-containing protein [Methanobrevibacter sp.]MBO7518288.1 2TM domain-containing protein [Methanobrevibacter sp.]MBO7713014.1 2TM domain-containing protein [Methanobrevibacter sp.]